MKLLILSLFFTMQILASDDPNFKEISDQELANKTISIFKDREIQNQLQETQEFKDCKAKAKFTKGAADASKKAQLAADCVKNLVGQKSGDELYKFADNLNLESYGLIKSKNVKDITGYIGNTMYRSLTGVDLDEQDTKAKIKAMKFGTKKFVDQKLFVTLYRSQLVKSALFEITTFCFTKLRNSSGEKTFAKHWEGYFSGTNPPITYDDKGEPVFGDFDKVDVNNKSETYNAIAASIDIQSLNLKDEQYEKFFKTCLAQIGSLCEGYEGKKAPSVGGNACLTKARLQKLRKGFVDTNKIATQFDTDFNGAGQGLALDPGSPALNLFNGDGEVSLDSLTTATSVDFLLGGQKNNSQTNDCVKHPENPECAKEFLVEDDTGDKIFYDAQVNLRVRTEGELARLKKLKSDNDANLKTYLTENGYLGLAENIDKWDADTFGNELEKVLKAKEQATIDALSKKIGSRQVKADADLKDKELKITKNAKEAKEERARLAQAVLFNNIVISQLNLEKKAADGTISRVGKNTQTLSKELAAVENEQIQNDLFSGLKSISGPSGDGIGNNSLAEMGFLDSLLGATKKP